MHNHLYHILQQWRPICHDRRWVLAAVSHTEGSVYRKAGALMLLSDQGDQLGLLSGGCLEADLQLQALKVIHSGQSRRVRYDARDQGGLAWRLGIGCGGAADILLHPCNADNNHLALAHLLECLERRQAGVYQLQLNRAYAEVADRLAEDSAELLQIPLAPPVALLVFGGGPDMQPLVDIAARLGWLVTLVDKRPANAQAKHFPLAQQVLNCSADELPPHLARALDAAIVANHSLSMDAAALRWLAASRARYIGLLGPAARKQQVLELAGVEPALLQDRLAGPLGLDLGGELPESIALAAISECHAVLAGRSGRSLGLLRAPAQATA